MQERGLRLPMALALVRLGRLEYLRTLGELLGVQRHEVQDVVPTFLIELARSRPEPVADELVRMLEQGDALARENAAWIAGAASAGTTASALRTALDDPAPAVRAAAAWALGMLQDTGARGSLARLAEGEDHDVAAFAREALGRIERGAS